MISKDQIHNMLLGSLKRIEEISNEFDSEVRVMKINDDYKNQITEFISTIYLQSHWALKFDDELRVNGGE
jgi:hypothetical protein